MYDTPYTACMAKGNMWTTKNKERQTALKAIRNELITKLAKDGSSYGALSFGEIAIVFNTTPASVSRLVRFGKNVSKPVTVS